MKKILLPILLFVMIMPLIVNAKEYCKVVSGNGKDIGSEITCGTEHFYIIDSNKDEVKMLAKYNLNVGVTIYKEKIEKESGDTRDDQQYCSDLANSKNGIYKYDGFYTAPGYCFYAKKIETNKVLQNEEAISAHWDKDGNYLYPQVGDVYYSSGELSDFNNLRYSPDEDSYFKIDKWIDNTKFMDYNYDFDKFSIDLPIINYTPGYGFPYGIFNSLGHYKKELNNMNYNVNSISLLSISELDEIVNKITTKRLPLIDWSNNYDIISQQDNPTWHSTTNNEISFGSLKEFIPNNYSWLYSTSYWNRTVFFDDGSFLNTYFVFTSGLGKICGAGFPTCAPETVIGTGIRPVVTIPADELQYLIKTETDGHGKFDVVNFSLGGETINFKVSTNPGYKLKKITVTTDSGEEVEFSEGEITKNDDGTFSIDKNKFTMPFENVTIQAKFELENILKNPETGDKVLFITLILVTSIVIVTFIYKKKEFRYNI